MFDLTFFELKKCRIYGQNSLNFSPEISPKFMFFKTTNKYMREVFEKV